MHDQKAINILKPKAAPENKIDKKKPALEQTSIILPVPLQRLGI